MKDNLPLLLTSAIAIISTISPFLTAIINNKHALKIKELDIKEQNYKLDTLHKRDIFEDYLSKISKFMFIDPKIATNDDVLDILIAYHKVLPYVPKSSVDAFRKFSEAIVNDHQTLPQEELTKIFHDSIVPCIKKEIESM